MESIPTDNVCCLYRQKAEHPWQTADDEPVFVGTGLLINGTSACDELPEWMILTAHEALSYAEWCEEMTAVFKLGGEKVEVRVEDRAGFISCHHPIRMNFCAAPIHSEDEQKLAGLTPLKLYEHHQVRVGAPISICSYWEDGELEVVPPRGLADRAQVIERTLEAESDAGIGVEGPGNFIIYDGQDPNPHTVHNVAEAGLNHVRGRPGAG